MFGAFIPAAYRPSTGGRWTAEQAETWLAFLARHLEQAIGAPDLAWWQLRKALPSRAFTSMALTAELVTALGAGLAVGLIAGLWAGLWFSLGGVFLAGVGGRYASMSQTAWPSYMLARGWLALHHRLPWSLMSFLDDAHQRGALRQAGAVYQFRHINLQHRLASRP